MTFSEDPGKRLKSFEEIPIPYRNIFSSYPFMNRIQSAVFDDIFKSQNSLVVTAPTGSGKTVLFELAIIKQILDSSSTNTEFKAVYIAPVKALCSERFQDWSQRFGQLNISCVEVTGDSLEAVDIQQYQIILTTPEKWDSMTRRWRDNRTIVQDLKLFLLDEIHLLRDSRRGPVLETVVCRMKTMSQLHIRFIALSATIFNIEDIAKWLGTNENPARFFRFGNEMRPVVLKRVVCGYPQSKGQSPFLFDIQLSYKLKAILLEHAEGKPVLIFCSTRRGVVQTCKVLLDNLSIDFSPEQRETLESCATRVSDTKLREGLLSGVGYHHAGISATDRSIVQDLFMNCSLPILVCTSTLAMGVNLPAHLVIIKSTYQYVAGRIEEYPESTVLQMIGRAGRPQFDTSATAVIMTRRDQVKKYEALLDCRELLESNLHLHLPEQLNAEIVLYTITDLSVAMDWLRCTFLYQRALANPHYYGMPPGNVNKIEKELEMLVLRDINALKASGLVELNSNGMDVSPTVNGILMSHYYLSMSTFRLFSELSPYATMRDLLVLLTDAEELSEIQLRVSERRILNDFNMSTKQETIRFPIIGKISTSAMKVNCLVQATLGCLNVAEPGLQQEARRAISFLERILKCLAEYISRKNQYCTLMSAIVLSKCMKAKLWENSFFVARQLDRIGPTLGGSLVACGKTSFSALEQSHPRELERIINRGPPAGNLLLEQIQHLPRYSLKVEPDNGQVVVYLKLSNEDSLREMSTAGIYHAVTLLVGDSSNRVLHQRRIPDSTLLRGALDITISIPNPAPNKVYVHVISEQLVGLDVSQDIVVNPIAPVVVSLNCHVTQPTVRAEISRKRQKTVKSTIDSGLQQKKSKIDVVKSKEKEKVNPPVIQCCFDLEPDSDELFVEPTSAVERSDLCHQNVVAETRTTSHFRDLEDFSPQNNGVQTPVAVKNMKPSNFHDRDNLYPQQKVPEAPNSSLGLSDFRDLSDFHPLNNEVKTPVAVKNLKHSNFHDRDNVYPQNFETRSPSLGPSDFRGLVNFNPINNEVKTPIAVKNLEPLNFHDLDNLYPQNKVDETPTPSFCLSNYQDLNDFHPLNNRVQTSVAVKNLILSNFHDRGNLYPQNKVSETLSNYQDLNDFYVHTSPFHDQDYLLYSIPQTQSIARGVSAPEKGDFVETPFGPSKFTVWGESDPINEVAKTSSSVEPMSEHMSNLLNNDVFPKKVNFKTSLEEFIQQEEDPDVGNAYNVKSDSEAEIIETIEKSPIAIEPHSNTSSEIEAIDKDIGPIDVCFDLIDTEQSNDLTLKDVFHIQKDSPKLLTISRSPKQYRHLCDLMIDNNTPNQCFNCASMNRCSDIDEPPPKDLNHSYHILDILKMDAMKNPDQKYQPFRSDLSLVDVVEQAVAAKRRYFTGSDV